MWRRERSLVVLIVSFIMLSMVIISLPVSQVSAANPPPITQSDTIIDVQQGQTFLVRTTITFNNAAAGGVFALSVAWDGPTRWDNYTLDNDNGFGAYAYWTSGGSGVGNPVENVDFTTLATLSGWSVGASIDATNKNYYDGTFNVDFWLKAANQGAPHQVGLENNVTYGAGIAVTEGTAPQIFSEDNVAINTTAWTGGVIVSGTENAYTIDKNPPIEMVNYHIGSQPPIIAAQTVGGGKVIAANIAPSLRNGTSGWDDTGNAHRTLDQLLDTIIQWAKPGATQVAWSNAPGMFEYSAQLVPLNLTDNMIAKWGYTIYRDNRTIENINDNYNWTEYDNSTPIDVLVIPEYEPGSATVGGDPTLLPDIWVSDLANWVENDNGVLIVIECADYSSANSYSRVNNKILAGLNMNWWFNNNSMYNDNDNYGGTNYHFYSNVDSSTAIGDTFSSASTGTGSNLIGMYSPSTLVPAPTLSSTLSIVPLENHTDNNGKTVTFDVTEHNTGSVADTFTMNISDDASWTISWPLVSTTNYYLVSEDAMVDNLNPTINFGSATTENLGSAVDNREIFLKFNLSAIPAQSISSAYLIMSFYPALGADNQMWADVLQVSDDSWTEGTIAWDNMPATGALIDTENLVRAQGPLGGPTGSYYTTWNVTSYVQSQFGNGHDNVASICVRAADNTDNTSRVAVFDSKEYSTATYRPYLVVTYLPLPYTTLVVDNIPAGGSITKTISVTPPLGILPGTQDNITITSTDLWDNTFIENVTATSKFQASGASVSISPGTQSGANNATLTYTVTVSNTGTSLDNYSLTVVDNASPTWTPQLSTTLLLNVPAGENGTATLTVTIPSNAIGGTIDNMTVTATSQTDNTVSASASCTAQATVALGVSVSISPGSQIGDNGATLTYNVTVTNSGNVSDNYALTVVDNASSTWSPTVSSSSIVVAPFSSDNSITLSVTIPDNAIPGTIDNMTVTATSQTDNTVSASTSSTAQAAVTLGVSVSISPASKSGANNSTLTYTVTVTNSGNVSDNFKLTVADNESWSPSVSPTSLVVDNLSSDNTVTLSVTVPAHAIGGTIDNMTVTATSQTDNTVSASASCTAQAIVTLGVSVSISPSDNSGPDNTTLTYTVIVTNQGNVKDNYALTVTDNSGWSENVSPTSLMISAFDNDNATLSVRIPENAVVGTIDNIKVTATSQTDNTVSGSDNCTAQASATVTRSVSVSISPASKSGADNTPLTFTVTVHNTGNVADNYSLTISDNASPTWSPSVSPTSLTVSAGGSGTATITVTVPSNAVVDTIDNIRVTATSKTDNTVSGSASCTAQASATVIRSVSVSISPTSKSGADNTPLTFTVTVHNTGNVADNYALTTSDNASPTWSPSVSPTSLTVSAGGSGTATITVTVPSNAVKGTIDKITVTATSKTDNTVSSSTNCLANSTGQKPSGISLWVYILIIVIIIVIVVIIATLLILKVL